MKERKTLFDLRSSLIEQHNEKTKKQQTDGSFVICINKRKKITKMTAAQGSVEP